MFSTILNILNNIFLYFFTLIYSVIHSHFISYVIIAGLSIYAVKFFFNLIQQTSNSKKKPKKITFKKLFLYSCFISSGLFSAWFLCIHFHTFRLL